MKKDYRVKKGDRHKEALELVWTGDGRLYLNFWDSMSGRDVVAQIIDGKLMCKGKEISMVEFIEKVRKSTEKP